MYKDNNDLINDKANTDIVKNVQQILNVLHDSTVGFFRLQNFVHKTVQSLPDEQQNRILRSQDSFKRIIYRHICLEIQKNVSLKDLDKSVVNKIHEILENPRSLNLQWQDIQDDDNKNHRLMLDELKFGISAENIMKYGFQFSCGNKAKAFQYVNAHPEKYPNFPFKTIPDVKIITTTCWNNLDDGMSGHTVPCVKMADGNYYAVDPVNQDAIFIVSKIQQGNTIYHLLNSMQNTPYRIMQITDTEFDDWHDFIKVSKINKNTAERFLDGEEIKHVVGADAIQEYLTAWNQGTNALNTYHKKQCDIIRQRRNLQQYKRTASNLKKQISKQSKISVVSNKDVFKDCGLS